MYVKIVSKNKKRYLDLLLLGGKQESMIDKYLERGVLFVLFYDGLKSVCVVTQEKSGEYEIKNIATAQAFQRQGYGKKLIDFVLRYYKRKGDTMLAGTGETEAAVNFYEHCGFTFSHRVSDFFVSQYNQPLFENGKQVRDMVYFKKSLHE